MNRTSGKAAPTHFLIFPGHNSFQLSRSRGAINALILGALQRPRRRPVSPFAAQRQFTQYDIVNIVSTDEAQRGIVWQRQEKADILKSDSPLRISLNSDS